jgi:IMP dehydrogenase
MKRNKMPTFPGLDVSFDDILIDPAFSMVRSRSDVDLSSNFINRYFGLPIIAANMDSIASVQMAHAMRDQGGIGALHRFQSIEDNVSQYRESPGYTFVSIGTGAKELDRAEALMLAGATYFMIDVAHGAAIHVVEQYDAIRALGGSNIHIVVGNFANAQSIEDFHHHSRSKQKIDAAKIGIGGGSMCTTRVVTGCGRSTLASILDCNRLDTPLIADGGFRTSGDIAKALAAGASAVMLGGMLAGTDESPGETIYEKIHVGLGHYESVPKSKKYRGSASKESYESQGKSADHRTTEGVATTVAYKGPVAGVMQQIRAGLLSAFSYVGASNQEEFQERAKLVQISNSTKVESSAHGVRK